MAGICVAMSASRRSPSATSIITRPTRTSVWPASWRIDQKDIADAGFVGFGIGYAWNNWLRFDVTGEYRMKEAFKVIGSYTEFCAGGGRCFDVYEGQHSNWLVLANAYVDLGTWWCLTPFVGAGVGASYHKFTGLTDVGYLRCWRAPASDTPRLIPRSGAWPGRSTPALPTTSPTTSRSNWPIATSTSVRSTRRSSTARRSGCAGTGGPRASYSFTNYYTQDIKIGMRWMLQPEPVYVPPPIMRKG